MQLSERTAGEKLFTRRSRSMPVDGERSPERSSALVVLLDVAGRRQEGVSLDARGVACASVGHAAPVGKRVTGLALRKVPRDLVVEAQRGAESSREAGEKPKLCERGRVVGHVTLKEDRLEDLELNAQPSEKRFQALVKRKWTHLEEVGGLRRELWIGLGGETLVDLGPRHATVVLARTVLRLPVLAVPDLAADSESLGGDPDARVRAKRMEEGRGRESRVIRSELESSKDSPPVEHGGWDRCAWGETGESVGGIARKGFFGKKAYD